MHKRFTRVAAVLAAGVLATGLAAVPASASPINPAPTAAATRDAAVEPNSVYSASIVDGQVGQSDLYNPLVEYLLRVPNGGVYWGSLNDGIVSVSKLAADTKAAIAVGTAQAASITAPVTVADVGGSIYDPADGQGATEVPFSSITLKAGKTYQIEYTAQAGWKSGETVVADTQFQVVPWLNVDADSVFSKSTPAAQGDEILGAVSATAFLPAVANRHATAAGSVTFTNTTGSDQPLQLGVFGYQDDQQGTASGRVVLQAANLKATLLN